MSICIYPLSGIGNYSFCLRLRYVTVVKAAYAVSFTLVGTVPVSVPYHGSHQLCSLQPCLYLMMVQVRPKRSADDYPRLTKAYVNGLCVGPFGMYLSSTVLNCADRLAVWALPVLVTPIPTIIRRRGPVSVIFNIVSLVLFPPIRSSSS